MQCLFDTHAYATCAFVSCSHMDVFDSDQFGSQRTQRLARMIIYLSEVEEGGETVFKKETGREGERDAGRAQCAGSFCTTCYLQFIFTVHCI